MNPDIEETKLKSIMDHFFLNTEDEFKRNLFGGVMEIARETDPEEVEIDDIMEMIFRLGMIVISNASTIELQAKQIKSLQNLLADKLESE